MSTRLWALGPGGYYYYYDYYYPPGPQAQRRVDILKYFFHLSKEEKNPLLVLPQRDGYTIKCTYTWLSQKKGLHFTR